MCNSPLHRGICSQFLQTSIARHNGLLTRMPVIGSSALEVVDKDVVDGFRDPALYLGTHHPK